MNSHGSSHPLPSSPALLRLRLILVFLAAIALPVGSAILYSFPPTEYGFYPRCMFHLLTGWHCPGCGATRCLHSLLHGDVEQALAFNALLVILSPLLVVIGVRIAFNLWTGRPGIRRVPLWALHVSLAVLVAFWVLRNIDVYPFNLLAPHSIGEKE